MIKIDNEYRILTDKWHSEVLPLRNVQHPDITIEVVKNVEGIIKLRKLWDDLISKSSGATIFQTYDWLYNWWKFFASENKNSLHVLLVSSYGKLIAIAPFYLRIYSFAGLKVFHQLKLMGSGLNSLDTSSIAIEINGVSDYLDIIVHDGYEKKVSYAISAYLDDFKYFFSEIDFQNIREGSFIYSWLLPELLKDNYKVSVLGSDVCPVLKVPADIETYMGSLKSGTRRKLKQIQKLIEIETQAEISNVDLPDYNSSLQVLKQLHQKRWNEIGHLGLFANKQFEKFISVVGEEFIKKDFLWFKVVKHNNKVIAARFAYKFKNRIYDYLSGFDSRQSSASLRPGITLVYSMIKDAMSGNIKTVDFLRGSEGYKLELASELSENQRIVAYHTQSILKNKINLFRLLKICYNILFRLKNETAIAKLHFQKSGYIKFVYSYLRFCFQRMMTYKLKHKTRTYNIHGTVSTDQSQHDKLLMNGESKNFIYRKTIKPDETKISMPGRTKNNLFHKIKAMMLFQIVKTMTENLT